VGNNILNGREFMSILSDRTGQSFTGMLSEKFPNEIPDLEWSKTDFLKKLPRSGVVLDVGCGNNSPFYTKGFLPEWHYIGIDVADYNQERPDYADEYIITTGELFASEILKLQNKVDAVISSHNLEHCDDRKNTVRFMAQALRPGGKVFLSFPSADSVEFPGRGGCLNYFDDYTHQGSPPDFGEVISIFAQEGVKIIYATTRYQPPIGWLMGLQDEPESVEAREVRLGTWWLWGFETIIWGEKL
jgi:SAM-dependent methyltransferase